VPDPRHRVLAVHHLHQQEAVVRRPAQEEGHDEQRQYAQGAGLPRQAGASDADPGQDVAGQDDRERQQEAAQEADGVQGQLDAAGALGLLHLQGALGHVVLPVDLAVGEVRRAEGGGGGPGARGHHPGGAQGAAALGEDGPPDAERPVQADHGQQEDGAEHVGVLEEAVELAEEDAEGPVVGEELLGEGEDSRDAEDEVGDRQIHQPHVSDLRLRRERTGKGNKEGNEENCFENCNLFYSHTIPKKSF